MAKKWNMIVDIARCDNCRNCFLATKDEHIGNEFPGYSAPQPERGHSWVDIKRRERGSWARGGGALHAGDVQPLR